MDKFFSISKEGLELVLCSPGDYYRGTRFDWAGIFRSITKDGRSYADLWFEGEDPFKHDCVCGCPEEFGMVRTKDAMLKIGVGLLRAPEDGTYDRFKLYDILDGGTRSFAGTSDEAVFGHTIDGIYDYTKTIKVTGPGSFEIGHTLVNLAGGDLVTDCYNHNFFTFGLAGVGSERMLDFPFHPTGHWREDSMHAFIEGRGIRFDGTILPGQKAFMGDLHSGDSESSEYRFSAGIPGMRVDAVCDEPMHHAVFWSNDRVACVEPYIAIRIKPRETFRWTIRYSLA